MQEMMMRNMKRREMSKKLLFLVTALMLVTLVLGACAGEKATPPAEKPVITIYRIIDASGVYASINSPCAAALPHIEQWINDTGGIEGYEVRLVDRDTGGALEKAIAAYEEFRAVKPKPAAIVFWETTMSNEALRERLNEDKIVNFTQSTAYKVLWPTPSYNFGNAPSYVDIYGGLIDWLVANNPAPVKLGILTWDSGFGKGFISPETTAYEQTKGVELVGTELFGPKDVDVSTQLRRLDNAGAQFIFNNTLGGGPAVILQSAVAAGLKDKMTFVGGPWAISADMVNIAGAEAAEGYMGTTFSFAWDTEGVEAIEIAREYGLKNNLQDSFRNMSYTLTWTEYIYFRQLLERTVDAVGIDNLSGETLREQVIKTTDDPIDCLGSYIYELSSDRPAPQRAHLLKVEGGNIVPATDFFSLPDLSPSQ